MSVPTSLTPGSATQEADGLSSDDGMSALAREQVQYRDHLHVYTEARATPRLGASGTRPAPCDARVLDDEIGKVEEILVVGYAGVVHHGGRCLARLLQDGEDGIPQGQGQVLCGWSRSPRSGRRSRNQIGRVACSPALEVRGQRKVCGWDQELVAVQLRVARLAQVDLAAENVELGASVPEAGFGVLGRRQDVGRQQRLRNYLRGEGPGLNSQPHEYGHDLPTDQVAGGRCIRRAAPSVRFDQKFPWRGDGRWERLRIRPLT